MTSEVLEQAWSFHGSTHLTPHTLKEGVEGLG